MKISLLFFAATLATTTNAYLRVCYYTNWAQYRPGSARFVPEDIDPHLCTHVVFGFAHLASNQLTTTEDNDIEMYTRLNSLKAQNPNLKTLLAVGGWNAGSVSFSNLASDVSVRKNFASTTVTFLRTHGFDGLDVDWEYPTDRGGVPADKEKFVLLLRDLKRAFKRDAKDTGRTRLLLAAAVAAGKWIIDAAYDIPEIERHLDFINVMTYDLHGSWESVTGHHAPLQEQDPAATLNLDWAARYWRDNGVPSEKLIIGLATYGRTFQLANATNNGIGAATVGSGAAGPYTGTEGFLAYYEVCLKLHNNEGTRTWNEEREVPYLVDGVQWIGYDDEESITAKLEYIRDNNYGGAMAWNLDYDDFAQICPTSSKPYPLMSLMATILDGESPTPATGPTNPSTQEPETPGTSGPTNEVFCYNKADGLYSDPYDCTRFYHCDNGRTYHKDCPPNLIFNPDTDVCDHTYNYDCRVTGGPTTDSTTEEPTPPPQLGQSTSEPGEPDPNFCDGMDDGLYKVEENCSMYYHCAHGNTYTYTCQSGLLYNAQIKNCDWEANVDCSATDPPTDF